MDLTAVASGGPRRLQDDNIDDASTRGKAIDLTRLPDGWYFSDVLTVPIDTTTAIRMSTTSADNGPIRLPVLLGVALLSVTLGSKPVRGQEVDAASRPLAVDSSDSFTNPLLPSGPDPWSIFHDGFYYYMHTTGGNLTVWKTRDIAELAKAERKVVWTPPPTGPYSKDIWAPEIHFLDGKWYIYFAADAGTNATHRMWVLENSSSDPLQGEWVMKGKIADPSDRWAIDGSVFEHAGRRYFVWSGWEGEENGTQSIYIAPMKNPWTLDGERVRISTPTYPWEKVGDIRRARPEDGPPHVDVNEGPQFLTRSGRILLIYSASGCWTDYYVLGMLSARPGADLLDPASWVKSPRPVFQGSPEGKAYAPGHNSFFKSPDGKEDWILYHANPEAGQGCGRNRSPRAQPFTWRPDGTPDFGKPIPVGERLNKPSGP